MTRARAREVMAPGAAVLDAFLPAEGAVFSLRLRGQDYTITRERDGLRVTSPAALLRFTTSAEAVAYLLGEPAPTRQRVRFDGGVMR